MTARLADCLLLAAPAVEYRFKPSNKLGIRSSGTSEGEKVESGERGAGERAAAYPIGGHNDRINFGNLYVLTSL